MAENEANPEALSQREATVYVAKMIAFLFVQTCSEAGDIRQMESRQIMRQMAFLADPDVKHLELPLATAIMAEKRQELGSYAGLLILKKMSF
jgi:hypothetical protein